MPVALIAFGYLCGSIPWGVLFARVAGVDVRRTGSGNIGATNVARSAGLGAGVATLAADVLKGALPVVVAERSGVTDGVAAAVGVAAFVGHVFPLTLRFAGGKGVATALGVLATLAPLAALSALVVFAAVVALTRYVSLGSLVGAGCAPPAVALFGYPGPVLVASLAMTAVIVVRHRDNFARLRAGTEARFTVHKRQAVLRK